MHWIAPQSEKDTVPHGIEADFVDCRVAISAPFFDSTQPPSAPAYK
jgi:hypothetical protein